MGPGEYVATWVSATGDLNAGISVQRFDSNGTRLGTEFKANSGPDNGGGYPAVAADPEGGFLVAWQSFGLEGPPTETGIFAQQFDSSSMAVEHRVPGQHLHAKVAELPRCRSRRSGPLSRSRVDQQRPGRRRRSGGGIFGQRFEPAP